MEDSAPSKQETVADPNNVQSQATQNPTASLQNDPNVQQIKDDETKTILTVLFLFIFTPIGVLLMWVWTKWKTWVKILVTCITCLPFLIVVLLIVGVFSAGLLTALNPSGQVNKARCINECGDESQTICIEACMNADQYYNSSPSD